MDINFRIPPDVVAIIGATLTLLILAIVFAVASAKKKNSLAYGTLAAVGLLAWGCLFQLIKIVME